MSFVLWAAWPPGPTGAQSRAGTDMCAFPRERRPSIEPGTERRRSPPTGGRGGWAAAPIVGLCVESLEQEQEKRRATASRVARIAGLDDVGDIVWAAEAARLDVLDRADA